jgi:DNA polymerase-3 subunit gamma/tau
MSHVALARKWRPQRFEDVIGQRGVIETLKNAIATGRLAHSFIFAGPRGVGKTTTARILSRALNCVQGPTAEPCGKCDACTEIADGRDMDVLEIDGATYTGVDAVREVIVEPLSIAPMRDRYKVFIIDEVHRLSKNAFDALLKSIEEPPPYVVFMMATTDLHSVPATIQSRSQVFELKALPFGVIRDQLKAVTKREKVTVEDAALALVARSAEGSMRDALSALDQILAFTTDAVTAADVSTVLGLIGRDAQFHIAEIVASEDAGGVFDAAGTVVDAGFDLRIVCRELARLMRDLLVIKIDPSRIDDPEIAADSERERMRALASQFSREDLMRAFDHLTRAEYEIKRSSQPRHQFEMTLVELIHLRKLTPLSELLLGNAGAPAGSAGPRRVAAPAPSAPPPAPARTAARAPEPPAPKKPFAPAAAPAASAAPSAAVPAAAPAAASSSTGAGAADTTGDPTKRLLATIREGNKTLFSMVVAQAQKIEVSGESIVFTFAPMHKSLAAQLEAKRAWVESLTPQFWGKKLRVSIKEGEPVAAPVPTAAEAAKGARAADLKARAKAEPTVQAVLDVFGGEIEDVEEIE